MFAKMKICVVEVEDETRRIVTKHGGKILSRITENVDYVISAVLPSAKILESAKKHKIPVVKESFVKACVEADTVLSAVEFSWRNKPSEKGSALIKEKEIKDNKNKSSVASKYTSAKDVLAQSVDVPHERQKVPSYNSTWVDDVDEMPKPRKARKSAVARLDASAEGEDEEQGSPMLERNNQKKRKADEAAEELDEEVPVPAPKVRKIPGKQNKSLKAPTIKGKAASTESSASPTSKSYTGKHKDKKVVVEKSSHKARVPSGSTKDALDWKAMLQNTGSKDEEEETHESEQEDEQELNQNSDYPVIQSYDDQQREIAAAKARAKSKPIRALLGAFCHKAIHTGINWKSNPVLLWCLKQIWPKGDELNNSYRTLAFAAELRQVASEQTSAIKKRLPEVARSYFVDLEQSPAKDEITDEMIDDIFLLAFPNAGDITSYARTQYRPMVEVVVEELLESDDE